MDEKHFVDTFLKPSEAGLNRQFSHPLPPIDGLEKKGSLIIQGEHENTFSTNIVNKYESVPSNIRLIDVYKCSQNSPEGVFVRLVGTMSLVKSGYPFVFLDAAVSNISPLTQQREDITTRVLIHLPQSTSVHKEMLFAAVTDKLQQDKITYKQITIPHMPDFWGPILMAQSNKLDMPLIKELRDTVTSAYLQLIDQTKADSSLDYALVKNHMVFTTSKNEGMLFSKMGLSVPLEAQAAFFSALTAGVDNPATSS